MRNSEWYNLAVETKASTVIGTEVSPGYIDLNLKCSSQDEKDVISSTAESLNISEQDVKIVYNLLFNSVFKYMHSKNTKNVTLGQYFRLKIKKRFLKPNTK